MMCTGVPTDNFETGTECGALGTAYGSAAVSRTNGQLYVQPRGIPGGCRTATAFDFSHGVSIKVVQIASSGMPNDTYVRAYNGADMTQGIEVLFSTLSSSPVVDISCFGASAPVPVELNYNNAAHLWWKIEAATAAQGTTVHAYYSANGTSWTDTSIACTWTSTSTVKLDVGTGASASGANLPAIFDDFNIKTCPP